MLHRVLCVSVLLLAVPVFGQNNISGTLQFNTGAQNTDAIIVTNGTASVATLTNTDGGVNAGWLRLFQNNIEAIRLAASPGYASYVNAGNFGVGTTNATSKLTVVAGTPNEAAIATTNVITTATTAAQYGYGTYTVSKDNVQLGITNSGFVMGSHAEVSP